MIRPAWSFRSSASIIFAWPSKPWLSQVHLQNQTRRTIITPSKPSYMKQGSCHSKRQSYILSKWGESNEGIQIYDARCSSFSNNEGYFLARHLSFQPPSSFSPPASVDSSFLFYSLFSDFFLMIIFFWRCDWLSNHFNQSDSNIFRDSGMLREDFDWIEFW